MWAYLYYKHELANSKVQELITDFTTGKFMQVARPGLNI